MKSGRLVVRTHGSLLLGGSILALSWASTAAAADAGAPESAPASVATLEEIVVTAQKRSERLQDVPVPVTALSTDSLTERNQTQFADYFREVPSVSLNSTGNGQNTIVIRGVTTGAISNPSVGITIDDIPFGSSSAYGYGSVLIPDLDPADLSRVEVLRGPQGTLYGAASLGGLVKFVTSDPSLSSVGGRGELDFNSVHDGSQGFGVRGSVSVPLITDQLGISVSGFKRQDPGFIDDPSQGRQNVNQVNVRGGHLATLWKPWDWLSLKLGVLAQDTNSSGTNSVDVDEHLQPTLGDLQHSMAPGTGGYIGKVRLYSAAINAKLGDYDLVSLSGYGVNDYQGILQFRNAFFAGLAQANFGVRGNTIVNLFRTKKFTQEVRLSSPSDQRIEWMVGGFYTHESTPVSQILTAADPATGATQGVLVNFDFPTTYQEYAAFGNVTFHITDQFDIQAGGRESENKQTYNESDFGVVAEPLFGSNPFVFPPQETKDNAFTYLVTPRYKISPDLMVYARLASGYRPGGNNGEATAFNLPLTFKPDKTQNYELGLKGSVFDRSLSFDTSIYYIDWKDVQLQQTDPISGISFFTNGGKARSTGAELALQSNPLKGLTLGATAAVGDAKLKQDLPLSAGYGVSGDRLPFAPKLAATFTADQEVPLSAQLIGFAGATVSYTGSRLGTFVNPVSTEPLMPGVRNELPSYTTVALRTGLRYNTWRLSFFVDNVSDKRGVLNARSKIQGSALPTDPYQITVIRPRTFGLSLSASY
jgi:outer membrane receptor protein involved in Fe transport